MNRGHFYGCVCSAKDGAALRSKALDKTRSAATGHSLISVSFANAFVRYIESKKLRAVVIPQDLENTDNVFYIFYVCPNSETSIPHIFAWLWGNVLSPKLTLKVGFSDPLNAALLDSIQSWHLPDLDTKEFQEIEMMTILDIFDPVRKLVREFQRIIPDSTEQEQEQDMILLRSPKLLQDRITQYKKGLIDIETLDSIIGGLREHFIFVGNREESGRIYQSLPEQIRRRVLFQSTRGGFRIRKRRFHEPVQKSPCCKKQPRHPQN